MRKGKTEKGITLIALIVTIVILLILAIVAINSITNDGLLGKAENVTGAYNNSVINEQGTISGYEDFLGKYIGGNIWTQDKTTVTNGKVTLEVGQTVTGYDGYSGSYDGGWAVLGAENGKLLLVSKVNVESDVKLKGREGDTANGYVAGYNNGIEYLNSLCASYLNNSLADEARSIKVEDICRIKGYNINKEDYSSGVINTYGNTVTYTMNSEGKIKYESDKITIGTANGTSDRTYFEHVDKRKIEIDSEGKSNSIEVTSTYYVGAAIAMWGKTAGEILLSGTGSPSNYYWLATRLSSPHFGNASFGLLTIENMDQYTQNLWDSSGQE